MALFRTKRAFQDAIISNDTLTIADYLKKSKDWLQKTDAKGQTPLQIAIDAGAVESFKMLVPHRKEMDGSGNRTGEIALHTAVRLGNIDMTRDLLALPEFAALVNRIDRDGNTPLRLAIDKGHEEILKMMIGTGKADLGGAEPAVYRAVRMGQAGSLNVLIHAGADVNAPFTVPGDAYGFFVSYEDTKPKYYSALSLAVTQNNTGMVQTLLEAGAKPQEKETVMCKAAEHGNLDVMAALLSYGQSLRETTNDRKTPLHHAAKNGRRDAVQFLLEHGADAVRMDDENRTAVSYAQQYAMKDIVDLLQDPAPVRPSKIIPAVTAAPKEKPPAPAVQAAKVEPPKPAVDGESWKRVGQQGVARILDLPSLQRKLTEIFNFETRERVTISENLATKVETTTPGESFDNLSEDALSKAADEYARLGGKVDAAQVFRGRITKAKYNPK